ncbi:MAG: DUF2063 domain-containing protein [Anaerolineae bacterium]
MSLANTAEQFTQFCRTGRLDPSLEVNPKRIQVYFELIRSNVEDVLKSAFPLTFHLLEEEQWKEVVDRFLAEQDSPSPFLWKMPQSFVFFVQKNHWAERFNIPYLDDLVDFEWVEIEVYMMPDCSPKGFKREGRLLDEPLYLNPESLFLLYSYPVFEKKKLPRLMEKGAYPLFAFRHPEDKDVHFIALSPFFQEVLQLIDKEHLTGRHALNAAAKKFNLDRSRVLTAGKNFLNDLLSQQAIYTRSS